MKATGIVRRIDDLGRVVIPKEIRRTLRIREGDPLEIYTATDGEVIFKKYSPVGELSEFAAQYADVLSRISAVPTLICDRDHIIAAAGVSRREYLERRITPALENYMESRRSYCAHQSSVDEIQPVEGLNRPAAVIYPIIAAGDVTGAVVMLKGDRITAVDSVEVSFLQDGRRIFSSKPGQTVEATVCRDGRYVVLPLQVDSLGRIGVYMKNPQILTRTYHGLEALSAGLSFTGSTIGGYLRDLRLLATPSSGAYKSVGSFIAIGQVFPSAWNWYQFVYLLGLFSIMLGVMNLLPIPGLDGGHIVFTLFEIVTGRKPSDRFMVAAQMVGMVLLLALMLLAFGNDIGRLIH